MDNRVWIITSDSYNGDGLGVYVDAEKLAKKHKLNLKDLFSLQIGNVGLWDNGFKVYVMDKNELLDKLEG